jgi:ATP-dependent exoDNAse (exonuclease V) beta subunit
MLNEKFTYKPLERVNIKGSRHYQTPDGQPLPSVTTVLDALKDKTALFEWRKRVGNEEADRIMRLATGIGTQVHLHLEKYILEEDRPNGSNLIHQMARELSEIVIEQGLSKVDEVWGTEVPLYYPGLYAGTTDCVGVYEGKPAIIDFQTTRKPKKREWIDDYFLQGAAYAEAHNEIYGTDIKTIVIMMIGWDAEADNMGNYQEFVVDLDDYEQYARLWASKVQAYFDKYM